MGPDDDLPTLISRKDHLNVLRSIRVNQLREPELVVEHGTQLLRAPDMRRKLSDESARLAALEQICLAALDLQQHTLAETCLSRLKETVGNEAIRFRMLLARCLEAADEYAGALEIYDSILQTHPANLLCLKRKYCLAETPELRMAALNAYLEQAVADASGWFEMAQLRSSLGDARGASFALEEVVLALPLDPSLHVQLAEAYASSSGTTSTLEDLVLARKRVAQALELDPTNRRAMLGLVTVSHKYLEQAAAQSKNNAVDDHRHALHLIHTPRATAPGLCDARDTIGIRTMIAQQQ